MPIKVSGVLNRSIFSTGDVRDVHSRYQRRVEIDKGISLTGFTAMYEVIDTADIVANSYFQIALLEDFLFDLNVEEGLVFYDPNYRQFVMFEYRLPIRADEIYNTVDKIFDAPYQLRYGHEYILYAQIKNLGVLTSSGSVTLTPYGFENVDSGLPAVRLR